ncbi:MAG TPA: TIGR03435 family protein [Bryobacteraceae bacterium]|jgi:uncharacterized protein (TIGR03435 family)|nr:TIGR03435 family protein [Bryobacteraceae bacterium]
MQHFSRRARFRKATFAAGLTLLAVEILRAPLILAQTTAPILEVASIKPSDPALCKPYPLVDGHADSITMTCVTVKYMIQLGYDVRDFQIARSPSWLATAQYDIAAKITRSAARDLGAEKDVAERTDAERKASSERLRATLQSLLADRFALKVHRETKQLPVYVLAVAKGGPKLKTIEDSADTSGGLQPGRGFLAGTRTGIPFFARTLSQILGRPVLNQTGLTGKYDFELRWTPDQSSPNGALGGQLPPSGPGATPPDPNATTIFTAIQEQLGLKLNSGKGPVELLVLDHIERPSGN